MDQALKQFWTAASRENRGRAGVRRRYSSALQAAAVRYWQRRREAGARLPVVAAALGVAPWSLRRWAERPSGSARFVPVQVTPLPPVPTARLVIVLDARGVRVEDLDVETAARLLTLLR
ncbi:MAG: hypothetical protein ABI051_16955 [Vicinamibacterales bacterium]